MSSPETYQQIIEKQNAKLLLFSVDGAPLPSASLEDWREHASDLLHAYSKLAEIEAIETERDALRQEVAAQAVDTEPSAVNRGLLAKLSKKIRALKEGGDPT